MKTLLALIVLLATSQIALWGQLPESKLSDGSVVLYVTRHGKTIFNTLERQQGWSDTPLTEVGIEVAECLGRGLQDTTFVAVYTSDSGRARETADWVMKHNHHYFGVQRYETADLREWYFGSLEGGPIEPLMTSFKTYADHIKKDMYSMTIEEVAEATKRADPMGMTEEWEQIEARVTRAVKRIIAETELRGGGNVLVVCHGLTIPTIIHIADKSKVKLGFNNASVTKITYKDGLFTVDSINDMQYVENGKQ